MIEEVKEVVSLTTAQRLKEAGLKHKLRRDDIVWHRPSDRLGIVLHDGLTLHLLDGGFTHVHPNHCLWLPRLNQLLAEVNKHHSIWLLHRNPTAKVWGGEEYVFILLNFTCYGDDRIFSASLPQEAVARGLVWILSPKNEAGYLEALPFKYTDICDVDLLCSLVETTFDKLVPVSPQKRYIQCVHVATPVDVDTEMDMQTEEVELREVEKRYQGLDVVIGAIGVCPSCGNAYYYLHPRVKGGW